MESFEKNDTPRYVQAVADILRVISTLGSKGRVRISPRSSIALCRVMLGHFSEEEGMHYVAMRPQSGIFYFSEIYSNFQISNQVIRQSFSLL